MNPTESPAGQFEVVPIQAFDTLDGAIQAAAIITYQQAFAPQPYNEAFSSAEATAALQDTLDKNGTLLLGRLGKQVVSLAGGYPRSDGTYYLNELAVAPDWQGKGYGRATLEALMASDQAAAASRLELRTTIANGRAIALYESEGFERQPGNEVVPQFRQNGTLALDERVYLSRPPLAEQARLAQLKRAAIAYPSGNTTAVVFDQLLSTDRKALNERIMQTWKTQQPASPEIEQCCFVTLPNDPAAVARVEMFGGEFCGNATRSAAWLLTGGANYRGYIEVSGAPRPLAFAVQEGMVTVEMPLPENGALVAPVAEGSLVQLDGITQLVVADKSQQAQQSARELLTALLHKNSYDLASQPAVGVSYYDADSGKAEFCVWVNAVDTIFDETACGSGTSAIGVALASARRTSLSLPIVQPSGETITTQAVYDKRGVVASNIAGTVDILYDGELQLQ